MSMKWTLQKLLRTSEYRLFLLDQNFRILYHKEQDLNRKSRPELSPSTKASKHSVYPKQTQMRLKLKQHKSYLQQAFLYRVWSYYFQNLSERPSSRTQSTEFQSRMPKTQQASWKRVKSMNGLSRIRKGIQTQRTPSHAGPWKLSNDLQYNGDFAPHRLPKAMSNYHELWKAHKR